MLAQSAAMIFRVLKNALQDNLIEAADKLMESVSSVMVVTTAPLTLPPYTRKRMMLQELISLRKAVNQLTLLNQLSWQFVCGNSQQ